MKTNLDALEILLKSLIEEMSEESDKLLEKLEKAEKDYPDTWGFEDPDYELNTADYEDNEQMIVWLKIARDVVQRKNKNV